MRTSRLIAASVPLLLACGVSPTSPDASSPDASPSDAAAGDAAAPDGAMADASAATDAGAPDGGARDGGPPASTLGGVGSAPNADYPPTSAVTEADWWVHGDSGDDGNSGTSRSEPLRTLAAALDRVSDGERIIVEGTLRPTSRVRLDEENATGVEIFNYGTDRWVLDFSDLDDERAVDLAGSGYFVKGVEIRDVPAVRAVDANGHHNMLEDFLIHHVSGIDPFTGEHTGTGIQSFGGRFNTFVDGLIYHLGDGASMHTNTGDCVALTGPGGDLGQYTHDTYLVRVMCINGPDDGYDLYRGYDNYLIDSVALNAGRYWNGAPASTGGDGFGFKMGGDDGSGRNHFIGCIAIGNQNDGWHHNTATEPCTIASSTAYGNGRWGFDVGGGSVAHAVEDCVAFDNDAGPHYAPTSATLINNSWDLDIADPLFHDPAAGDFSLGEGSEARGAARDGDHLGASRAALELVHRHWDVR